MVICKVGDLKKQRKNEPSDSEFDSAAPSVEKQANQRKILETPPYPRVSSDYQDAEEYK